MADGALSAVGRRVEAGTHSLAHEVAGVRLAVRRDEGAESKDDDGGELYFDGMD